MRTFTTAALGATTLTLALCASAGTASAAPAAPAVTGTVHTAATSVNPAWCTAAMTRTSVSTVPGSGAAGHYSLMLTVTNTSTAPCRLRGYPGLQLLATAQGPTLGAPATRTPAPSLFVTLIPNGRAVAEIQVTQAASYPTCTHRAATQLQVFLPDSRVRQAVPLPRTVDACTQTSIPLLAVKPLVDPRR